MRHPPRKLVVTCYVLAAVIALYWTAWFSRRSLVATEATPVYVNFEQAFPLADGFIVVFLLLSARALGQRSSSALLFLLLGIMDVLFDLEHGIWSRGVNGVVELAINVVTFAAAIVLARWVWFHRHELDDARDERGGVGQ